MMTKYPTLTLSQIEGILGEVDADKAAAILKTGASEKDLEEVRLWLAGEDDVMGDMRRPLTGAAAAVYEILAADAEDEEEL